MVESLRLPAGDLIRIPREALGILLENHSPGTEINEGTKMVPYVRKVVTEDRMDGVGSEYIHS